MPNDKITEQPCGLCGRGMPTSFLTRHHCKPKSKGGTNEDVELICSQCHSMVHATFTNETLAAIYATLPELRKAAELQPYIRWIRKQPSTSRSKNKPRKWRV